MFAALHASGGLEDGPRIQTQPGNDVVSFYYPLCGDNVGGDPSVPPPCARFDIATSDTGGPVEVHTHLAGPIGLAPGQIARLSVADPGSNSPSKVPPSEFAALLVYANSGIQLGKSLVPVVSGQTTSLELSYAKLVNSGIVAPDLTGRIQVFAPIPCSTQGRHHSLHLVTLEILDADTGRTTAVLETSAILRKGGTRPEESVFGAVGLAGGQTARLSVVQAPLAGIVAPDAPVQPPGPPEKIVLTFFDTQGNVLRSSQTTITRGQIVTLDLVAANLPPGPVRASFKLEGPAANIDPAAAPFPPDPCRGTLEIFDGATGKTSIVIVPAVQR